MTQELMLDGMRITAELITPEVARQMLARNRANRNLRMRTVRQYTGDMTRGAWITKPCAIALLRDGSLGNGQHTLHAIIASGRAQYHLVARDCTPEQIAAMDVGLRRTISEVGYFLGSDMNKAQVSLSRFLKWGPSDTDPRSFDEVWDAFTEQEDDIRWAAQFGTSHTKGFSTAVLAASIVESRQCGRALLERFLTIVRSGVTERPSDTAAIKLRDYIRTPEGRAGTSFSRLDTYRRTRTAIRAFAEGRAITRLFARAFPDDDMRWPRAPMPRTVAPATGALRADCGA